MRVIDFLTDAATKPVVMADATAQNLDAMPVSALPMPDEQESRKETAI